MILYILATTRTSASVSIVLASRPPPKRNRAGVEFDHKRNSARNLAACHFPIFLVIWRIVKTTVELPDDLVREVKVRAAREGRRLKEVMADVVRRGLADPPARERTISSRVRLPLVQCSHPASPDEEMTPERAAQILLAPEVTAAGAPDESLR